MQAALLADLGLSKLSPKDINAREAGPSELAAVNIESTAVQGYVIPYYDIEGNQIPFYRVKLIDHDPKYKQPKNTGNHIYFPKMFIPILDKILKSVDTEPYIILTEGEKKAVAATKEGFPTVAVGGVQNWRNKTIVLPPETVLSAGLNGARDKVVQARLPNTGDIIGEITTLAIGLQPLIDLLKGRDINLIITFDSDLDNLMLIKPEVQKAAASLGYELRHQGIAMDKIRQMILTRPKTKGNGKSSKPSDGINETKLGLDDYLIRFGSDALSDLITETLDARSAFPRHPNPRAYVNSRLQKGRLSRKDAQNLAMSILTELDARGRRIRSKSTSQPYYFDEQKYQLMPASLLQKHGEPMHESAFGKYLYEQYGISASDTKLITWLATQFTGEEPIEVTEPRRVLTQTTPEPDTIAYQISDSHFVIVSGNPRHPITIHTNGSSGILFEQDHVNNVDAEELVEEFHEQNSKNKIHAWWADVLSTVNLSFLGSNVPNDPDAQELATLLFYVSPWLRRWRDTQLPVELIIGEAGSGKSSLYSLRLSIITGRPLLRNVPGDLRDWHASVTNTGGLHVTDNVQFTNKELRQRLSDEICRIITEPDPHVEMRKLYTTSAQTQVPVRTSFAMTAIQQPFHNADLIQRAAIFELAAIQGVHDGSWVNNQLDRFGGRISWMAHHLVVLHRFLKAVTIDGAWDTEYSAVHRLTNYEQCLAVMADVLNIKAENIISKLVEATQQTLSESDWALEGLKEFVSEMKPTKFTASDIAAWAQSNEEYSDNNQLTNARRLGRYIQSHKMTVQRIAGIKEIGIQGNRKLFKVDH